MRVLFTSLDGSHFQLLVPTAWALRTAGHDVRVACKADLVDKVTTAGLTAVVLDCRPWTDLLGDFHQKAIAHYSTADVDVRAEDRDTWESHLAYESIITPALNIPLNSDQMIDELVAVARAWRPDLVVWESLCIAGAIAATVVGAAHARLVSGPDLAMQITTRRTFRRLADARHPQHREDPTADWLGWTLERLGSDHGFDETMLTGRFTIDMRPASLREDMGLPVVAARYVPYNGAAVVPRWLAEPCRRPRVCVTLGVSIADGYRLFDLPAVLGGVLQVLATMDVEVVAAVAEQQRAHLPPPADNVRIVDYVPMNDLLPTCAAVVHHAGYQTKATAELHGVPQVVFTGWEWVSEEMGTAYEKQGNLLAVPLRTFTPETFQDRITRVLDDPGIAEHARRLRQEMAAMLPPNDIVPLVEKLTRELRA